MVSREFDFKLYKFIYVVRFPNAKIGQTSKVERFSKETAVLYSNQRFKTGNHGEKQFKLDVAELAKERL